MSSITGLRVNRIITDGVPGKTSQLLLATTALTGLLLVAPAGAVEYKFGEVGGSVDTILSAGASMRTSARDCENVGDANGGCQKRNSTGLQRGSSPGVNTDDGNLNYDQWDVFSGAMKATSEVQASFRNFGAFVRGTAFIDPIVDNVDFRDLEHPQRTGRTGVSQNAKLLDYFVSGSFEVGSSPLEIKLGNQVISWGESTFIQNGLSQINPIDVAAVRKPGSELKEFFVPILAARASLGLPNNFSIDGFYQFKADQIVPDPSGTFFSAADIVGRGSQPIRGGAYTFGDDGRFNPFVIANGLDHETQWYSAQGVNVPAVSIERNNDKRASDGGEFGFALRYFASEFNQGTEFGLFFMNLHSRLPIVEFSRQDPATAKYHVTPFAALPGEIGGFGSVVGAAPPGGSRNAFEVAQSTCNIIGASGGTFAMAANGVGSASTPFSFDPNADGVAGFGAGDAAANSVRDLAAGRLALALPGGYTNCNNMVRLFNRGLATIDDITAAALANTQSYRLHYPKDVQTVGLSVSTTVSGIAVQAEATYRHDQPFNYAFAEQAALANDLSGQTAFATRAPQAGGLSPFGFPAALGLKQVVAGAGAGPGGTNVLDAAVPGYVFTQASALNQTAARSGQTTFTDVAALQEALLGLAPGAINRGTPPIPGLPVIGLRREIPAALADKAAAGTLTAADVLGILPSTAADAAALGIPFNDASARAAQVVATSNATGYITIDALNTNPRTTMPTGTPLSGGVNAAGAPVLSGFIAPASAIVSASPADVPLTATLGGLPVAQTKASVIPASAMGRDGFIKPAYEDVFTAQTTLTSLLFASNPVVQFAAADGGVLVTEIGMVMVPGISTSSGIAGGNTKGLANSLAAQTAALNADLELASGYATKFSWGAQGLMSLTYNRAFGSPVNLSPSVAWKWDFGGNTPAPFGNYQAERKAITIGINGTYLANWAASLSWTSNFGPDAPLDDRDFASATVSYAF